MPTLEALLEAKLPQLRALARQLTTAHGSVWDEDDLCQEGVLGFLAAVTRYNAAQGATLWTYVECRVGGAMRDARRALDPAPRSLRRKAQAITQAVQALGQQLGHIPDGEDVAQALGISLDIYEQWRAACACLDTTWRLDYTFAETEGDGQLRGVPATPLAFLADTAPGPAAQAEQRQRAARLSHALALLPVAEQQVVHLRYWEELSLQAIGVQLGLSESRISQLHTAALARLRGYLTMDDEGRAVAAEIAQRQAGRVAQAMERQHVRRTHGHAAYLRLWRAQQRGKQRD